MLKRLAILLIMLCHGGYVFLHAQCTNGTQPECACETAPVLCTVDELDGYQFSMTSYQHPGDGPTPICPGAFQSQSNNPTWFAFTAWCTDLTLRVSSGNCEEVFNFVGFQLAIYSDCSFNNVVACNADPDDCTTDDKTLNMTGLNIGEVYYFLVDGCLGSYCDVTIDVIGVCGQEEISPWTSLVTGPTHVCTGDDGTYTIENLQGAGRYHWFIDGVQVTQSASTNLNLNWPTAGTYELCIDASNDPCVPITNDPTPLCVTITVHETEAGVLDVAPSLLCVNETATITSAGFANGPNNVQMLLITDAIGTILEMIPVSSGTFAPSQPGTYFIYSYNFIPATATLPIVGGMISDIDCTTLCCDLESQAIIVQQIGAVVNDIVCYDNGTGNDLNDDTFTFNLLVTGPHTGSVWQSSDGTLTGLYGTLLVCGPYPVSAGMLLLELQDRDIPGCATSIEVTAPMACSFCTQSVDAGTGSTLTCVVASATLAGTASESGFYQWTGPDFFEANTLTITVNDSGWYFFTTEFINECTAIDSVFVDMDISFPVALAGPDQVIDCQQTEVLLDGSASIGSNVQYEWIDENGTVLSSDPTLLINQTGTYTLTLIDVANGCTSTDMAQVTEDPNTLVFISAMLSAENCVDQNDGQIIISGIEGGTPPFAYMLNGLITNSTGEFFLLAPGDYSVNITDVNGCVLDTFLTIAPGIDLEINLTPVIEIVEDQTGQIKAIINVPITDLTSIQWNPPGLVGCDTCLVTTIETLSDQSLQLTIMHVNGCIATAEVAVTVVPKPNIYIPNVFSPNRDGYNDFFTLYANSRVELILTMDIFDRWGAHIFHNQNFTPNDPAQGWDGRFREKPMSSVTYTYFFEWLMADGTKQRAFGDVTVVK